MTKHPLFLSFQPLISEIWVEYSTTVLPLPYLIITQLAYVYWLFPGTRGRFQTFDLGIMCQVFYHCATSAPPDNHTSFYAQCLSPGARGRIRTLDLGIMCRVFYHCATMLYLIITHLLCSMSLSLGACDRILGIMCRVFYHCAITAIPDNHTSFMLNVSFLVPVAGF